VAQQQAQIRWLELRVKDLETQLFGKKSEKWSGSGDDGNLQWDELLGEVRALAPVPAQPPTPVTATEPSRKTGLKKGPKPLDPALPREVIAVPAPDLKDLICPETGRAMQAAFVEVLEVLARKPAVYFVKRYGHTHGVHEPGQDGPGLRALAARRAAALAGAREHRRAHRGDALL
jgi:hypothetical protein